MRNLKILFLSFFICLTACSFSQNGKNSYPGGESNSFNIYLADATIFEHQGVYYLYGTKGDPNIDGEGFLVYSSTNLKDWTGPNGAQEGFALKKGDAFGSRGFWAPQVFEHQGEIYMAYTANEKIAIAKSDSPLGPFTNTGEALEAPVKQIDPFIFIDDNGKKYLYHVRLNEGNRIFVAEMNDDLKSIKPETLKECISAEEQWEDTEQVKWPVAEGPTIIKKEGIYYLIYSANDYKNPDYAVGYAISENPLGPWKKSENNPIIYKGLIGEYGPGHGDVVIDKKDELQYVLHAHFSKEAVHPRKTALTKLNLEKDDAGPAFFKIDKNSFRLLKLN